MKTRTRSPSNTQMPAEVQYCGSSKRHYCVYCQKSFSKISRHLKAVHLREPEVAEAFGFNKGSKERRVRLFHLNSKGDYLHNAAVSKSGNGVMVACRRPKEAQSPFEFSHCVYCLGLYKKKTLWKHSRQCPQNTECNDPKTGQKRVLPTDYLSSQPPKDIGKGIWTVTLKMNNDEVSAVVRNDRCILLLGDWMYNKLKSPVGRNVIRQKMREVARLLITAKSLSPVRSMEDLMQPCNFPHVIKAVQAVAGFSEESNTYKTPSLTMKLGYSLVIMANSVESNAEKSGDHRAAESARNFRELCKSKWSKKLTSDTLGEEPWKKVQLPLFTGDVKTLHSFLNSKRKEHVCSLREKPSGKSFAALTKVLLTQITLLNRRRQVKVSKMRLESYVSRDREPMHKDITVGLSDLEKQLCGYFQRVEMTGTRGGKVPVLLTPDMVTAMDLLVNTRETCGVPVENQHMFTRPGVLSHYVGEHCLRQYAQVSGAKHPDALCSTKLRKQVATLYTVLNLTENEMGLLANFLGHEVGVHREFCRLPESTPQLAKISKILIAKEKGRLPELQSLGLDGITVDQQDEVDVDSGSSGDEAEPPYSDGRTLEFWNGLQMGPKSATWLDMTKSRPKQGTRVIKRMKWSEEEVAAVEKHMMRFITRFRVPGKKDCVSCLLREPQALGGRDWSAVKFYIHNRITCMLVPDSSSPSSCLPLCNDTVIKL